LKVTATKMNKSIVLLLSGLLMISAAACDSAKTSTEAPSSTQDNANVVDSKEASDAQDDAMSETRRNQVNSDIRAREDRNNAFNDGSAANRDDSDLASQVRSKLEANLPASALVVDSEEGVVTVTGTVPTQEQYDKITALAQEIKGVKSVNNTAKVAPAQPEAN
jgi:hyperosmotically inducible periplasmic protein